MNLWTNVPLILAHRGDVENQNTLTGFRNARKRGFDGVELDVRRTVDNVLVVNHDPTLNDIGVIGELSFDQLRSGAPFVPTLAEALDELAGLVVNIEIKSSPLEPDFDPTHRVSELAARLLVERRIDRAFVSSFNPGAIDAFRAVNSVVPVGLLVISAADPMDALGQVVERGYDLVHPNVSSLAGDLLGELVEAAHRAEKRVLTWTVNEPTELARHREVGVDAICTDTIPN